MCRSRSSREGSSHIAPCCELTVTSGSSRARSEPQFPHLDIRESDTAPFWDVRLNRTPPVLGTRDVRMTSRALRAAPGLSFCPHIPVAHPQGG